MLLNGKRGCFRPAPYVDKHGETDVGLKSVVFYLPIFFVLCCVDSVREEIIMSNISFAKIKTIKST